jgi:hypothetical protein
MTEADAPEPAQEPAPKKRSTPRKAFWGRFMLGHFIAYPVCFLTAAAALPFAMVLRKAELMSPSRVGARTGIVRDAARNLKLTGIEAAQVEIVLEVAMWACIAVLVLMHLAVLPWSFGAAGQIRHPERGEAAVKRGFRIFAGTTATTVVALALAGTAGWIWVLTR